MRLPHLSDFVAAGYLVCWRVVRFLPPQAANWLTVRAADWVSDHGRGMPQLRRNLMRVVGPENVTRVLVRDAVRSYARYWEEAFRLPAMAGNEALQEQLQHAVEGSQRLARSVAADAGVVLVLPHSGNWDLAGLYVTGRYGAFATVAERVRPEALFQAFVSYRESLGFEVLAHAGGPPPMDRLREVLESGGIVCLVGERDLKGHGHPVEFFGEQTTMPTGAVELARQTGAALHVVHCWFEPEGWGFTVGSQVPRDSTARMMQRVADEFAANIAAHPADWHMLQPLWPADRLQIDARRRQKSQQEQGPCVSD